MRSNNLTCGNAKKGIMSGLLRRLNMPALLLSALVCVFALLSLYAEVSGSVKDGLFAYYPLNGNASDESGNGYHGSVIGATPTTDRFGNRNGALYFNGTNSYINLGTRIDIPSWSEYSISLWFLNDGGGAVDGYGQKILDKTILFHDFYLTLSPSSNQNLRFMSYENGPNDIVDNSKNYKDGLWHHVVIKKYGNHGELWVDGVLKGTSQDVKTVYSSGNLIIGYSLSPDKLQRRYFSGKIGDLRIYRRAVSSSEINELYKEKKEKAPEPKEPTESPSSDTDIRPVPKFVKKPRPNDLAIIIGIEKYQNVPPSDFSSGDAKLVMEYIKALGFSERNIGILFDDRATYTGIKKSIETWLPNRVKNDSTVFIYYSGHGSPDPATGEAYIVPYDGDPNYLSVTGYSLKRLYRSLGKLNAREVVIVLDSCFSGAGGRSVLAKGARPLVMVAETVTLSSNMVVLTATQGNQISSSSPERGHGIFTFYFLKSLKDGKKNIAEIYEYIKPQVEDEAKQLNVEQSPSLTPAPEKLTGKFFLRK